jgi:hypothetical protein
MTVNISTLFTVLTQSEWFSRGLEIARVVGLPVTTWRTGDPTRSYYLFISEILASLDGPAGEFVRSSFLSSARGDWLRVLADEVYGVVPDDATYAEPTVTLTNTGGGVYEIEAGDLTVRASTTSKTYHSTSVASLGPGDTETVQLVADEAGSDSSVGVNEIDEFVTSFDGVEIASSTAGLANDAATDDEVKDQCRASRGALSPNGPADAYIWVAKNSDLTGLTGINRAASAPSTTGLVTVTVASQSGAVLSPALDAIEAAILRWATPLCGSVVVVSATEFEVDGIYTIYKSPDLSATTAEITAAVYSALDALFAATRIGGQGGVLSEDAITEAIRKVFPNLIYRITGVTDVTLTTSQIPVRGDIAIVVQ